MLSDLSSLKSGTKPAEISTSLSMPAMVIAMVPSETYTEFGNSSSSVTFLAPFGILMILARDR